MLYLHAVVNMNILIWRCSKAYGNLLVDVRVLEVAHRLPDYNIVVQLEESNRDLIPSDLKLKCSVIVIV